MKRFVLWLMFVLSIVSAMLLSSLFQQPSQAQADRTAAKATVDAIIGPRLTLTARGVQARTATAGAFVSRTVESRQTGIALTAADAASQTVIALTITRTPTNTLTPSVTFTPSLTPTPTLSATPITEKERFETIQAIANLAISATSIVRATAEQQQTINAIIAGTLRFTMTPTPTSTPTATATATVTNTATTTYTATATATRTATPTATTPSTLSPDNIRATGEARLLIGLTATIDAQINQSIATQIGGTLQAIDIQNATLSALITRSTLAAAAPPIDENNIGGLDERIPLVGHVGPILGLAFNGLGDRLVTAGADKSVYLWDAVTGSPLFRWEGLTDRSSIAFSSDGARIVAASSDSTLRLYNALDNSEIAVIRGHVGPVLKVVFSPNSRFFVSAGADKTVRLWNSENGAAIGTIGTVKDFPLAVNALALNPQGTILATSGRDGQITFFELSSGTQVGKWRDQHRATELQFNPDGTLIASVGSSSTTFIYNVATKAVATRITINQAVITTVSFSPVADIIALGTSTGTVQVFTLKEGRPLFNARIHPKGVSDVSFSPDGTRLASVGQDEIAHIFAVNAP